jgi:universal stress protein A
VSGFARLLVATDFSDTAEKAWTRARDLARALGAELVLLHVFVEAPLYSETPFNAPEVREVYESGKAWVTGQLEKWATDARAEGLRARTVLRTGVPYREILAAAEEERADIIVIGTHGRGGLERALLGSVADRVVRLAPCPVLTIRDKKA